MARQVLKNKPLVEAMLEIRWQLTSIGGQESDPHYKILLGRLFDRLSNQYPDYEQLPTANIPDGLVGHVVQHRFRVAKASWPLVQVGPGIMTVNSTDDYTWEDFEPRLNEAMKNLFEAYPKVSELKISTLILRYIDAVAITENDNAFEFIRDKLKIKLELPESLFDDSNIANQPVSLNWQSAFRCNEPKGFFSLQMGLGQRDIQKAIVWDTSVQSVGGDLPSLPDGFAKWVDSAHKVTSDCFFKLIEGELERRFSNE